MNVSIRKFEEKDIANKVEWVNNPQNNTYLHYALPLEYDKTLIWFENNKNRADRYDAVIEVDEIPVGLIGLLSIDYKNKKAEYYVLLGSVEYKGKGISKKASKLLLKYAFETLDLNKVYLYTEVENYVAQKLFESIGFLKEGRLYDDVWSNNKYCDRYIYGICKNAIYSDITQLTPIHKLDDNINTFYIKREDLLPFSFGGNKARKALLYFEEIDKGNYDIVITYGSASSNHCRVVSNLAASRDIECIVICPEEQYFETYNKKLVNMVAAKYITCPLDKVNETIEETLFQLRENGFEPYFIPGGGHGNIGTQAYVNCYKEIKVWERDNDISFDYIFHASGTGTTQAGLVCGKLLYGGKVEIVGISIARKNPRGSQIIIDSVNEFLDAPTKEIEGVVKFIDEYIGEGYGKTTLEVNNTLNVLWKKYGIPMDSTYTAKAYAGMLDYLKMNKITNKNILFIHTGGAPLFFDCIKDL